MTINEYLEKLSAIEKKGGHEWRDNLRLEEALPVLIKMMTVLIKGMELQSTIPGHDGIARTAIAYCEKLLEGK